MQLPWFSNLRGDIVGGLMSAIVAIPLAIGFGMFAFVALGDDFFGNGALAGLYTAVAVGAVSVLSGNASTAVYAPRVITTFFIGSLLHDILRPTAPSLAAVLATIVAIILLAGLFQMLFGAIRLGSLIKYTPHPVMAGFQNAAAALLLLVQLGNIMGFDKNTPFTEALAHVTAAKPLSVLIALVTILVMWHSRRLVPKLPPLLAGLIVGTAIYYATSFAGFAHALGPVLGSSVSDALRQFTLPQVAEFARGEQVIALLPTIVGGALALALIASIDALLCAKLVARPGDPKTDGDRLLIRLGLGNMAAASFGGITSGFNIGASLTGRAFGARTPLSVVVNGLLIAVTIAALFPIVGYLPRVTLSAVIVVIAIQHFDPWTVRLLRRVATGSTGFNRTITIELLVVLVVAVLSVTVNIVLAVFIGLAIAVALFLVRMSRSPIRRTYRCNVVRSRKSRRFEQTELLERRGSTILTMELQGALFFGSAEKLADDIAAASRQETKYLVLDLRRVTEIDSTGCQVLLDIRSDLAATGKQLVVAVARTSDSATQLADAGVFEPGKLEHVFPDIDRAMEWAEDDLLARELHLRAVDQDIPLDQVSVLRGFGPEELAAINSHLRRAAFDKGDVVFREGEPGTELFIIARGTASAYLTQTNGGNIRLVTFASGTVFGELAILDKDARSATVIADDRLFCYVLSAKDFDALSAQLPAAAIKLLANLGRELSSRLRRTNRTIHQLES